jgi:ribonucleotide reductase alpha subunit
MKYTQNGVLPKTYSYDEVFESTLNYFNGDSLAAQVWIKKYSLKNMQGEYLELNPDQMHHRLSAEIHRIEEKYPNPLSYQEIYEALKDFTYIVPQGGPMTGIGNNHQVMSLSNCFVVGNDYDSYGGIMRTDEEQIQLMKRRGGVGHDLSHLRPSGMEVNNSARTSTGAASFMERYSDSTREVAQEGRRGALMLSLSIAHPDAEKFIDMKMDGKKVTGANVSVRVTDHFMRMVKDKAPYVQRWPVDSPDPTIKRTVSARRLWEKMMHNAWASAEPGVLFWDTITRESLADCYAEYGFKTTSTNPCFSGDMELLTVEGYKKFKDIVWTEQTIFDNYNRKAKAEIVYSGKKMTYNIRLSDGTILQATEDHKFVTHLNNDVAVKDLKGHKLMVNTSLIVDHDEEYIKFGFIQGDGQTGRLASETHKALEVNIGNRDGDIAFLFNVPHFGRRQYLSGYNEKLTNLGFSSNPLPTRTLPISYSSWSDIQKLSFLRGLFSANGSVIRKYRVALKSTCKDMVDQVKESLAYFGIESYITTNKPAKVKFPNGEYIVKESYDLNIGKFASLRKFSELISFEQTYKQTMLEELIWHRNVKVTSVKPNKVEHVFDFKVQDKYPYGYVNGFMAHNCGEIPLCPYDSCRLLALNLYSFVDNPFTLVACFNETKFEKYARMAARIMDDIVDLELEKIDQIISKIKSDEEPDNIKQVELGLWRKIRKMAALGRRTGIGITGMGDMLAALGLTYGDTYATEQAVKTHQKLAWHVLRESNKLAEERGAFPIHDYEYEKDNPFLTRVLEYDAEMGGTLLEDILKYGRRNIASLTIAPTGTTSLMTQTTSGIEPCFMIAYKRRTKINPNDPETRVDFVDDVGDSWQEHFVFHHHFKTWAEAMGYELPDNPSQEYVDYLISLSPYKNATANDVDWVGKIKMQGAVQKWVDHSISVTVNLPNDVPEELVSDIYMAGWESGCKGVTIYRDGSRSGVLVSNDSITDEKKFVDNHAIKRPVELEADVQHFRVGHRKWVAIVGLMDGRPYEIFSGRNGKADDGDGLNIPEEITSGIIRKKENGENKYYLESGDFTSDDLSKEFNPNHWGIGKMISMTLRHGAPIQYVVKYVEGLDFDGGLYSWKMAIARALKKFIPEGTYSKEVCENCGEASLVYQEGCLTCQSCGHAKCG